MKTLIFLLILTFLGISPFQNSIYAQKLSKKANSTTLIQKKLGYSYTDIEFENYIVPVFKYRKGMSKREFAHRLYNLIIRAKGVVSPISDLIGENSSSTALTTTNSLPATTGTRAVTRTTGLTKTKKSDIEAPKNEDGHPDECLAGLKVNDPIFQTTANKVGITKERVEYLLSRKGICTGDIGAIDFLADLFGTNFEDALKAMASEGKMGKMFKIDDYHYKMQSNEAFIDKYDTSLNPNTAGGDFEGFIATSFGGEKGRNTGIGFWEDPETKTTWTHRDVDVIFGKEIIPPYQVEVSNNTGTEPTGEKLFYHYSAFVEVKAGKNFLKRNVDETRVLKFVLAFTRGRLVANHYLSKYSNNVDLIFVTKYPVNIRDLVTVFENLLKSTGTIWLEIYK